MRKFISCLLALCTLWMSTWLVTDIHDVAAANRNQPHPIFSTQIEISDSDPVANFNMEAPHCEVCSYDHGGHMGQALVISRLTSVWLDCRTMRRTFDISGWFSHTTPPKQRPPIV